MAEGRELAQSVRRLARVLDASTAAAVAGHGVSTAEWALLRALHRAGAVPPSVLAVHAGLSRGAITKLVDRLRAKRLLVRAAGGVADRRFQTIALTGEGVRLVNTLTPLVEQREVALFAGLPPARRNILLDLLSVVTGPAGASGA